MKIPAIRAKIGDWTYYITTLTFQQISEHVEEIDDEVYSSDLLKDLLQRSITNNYFNIKKYILNQEEMFFNSLVLAVYDDYPDWIEIEISYEDEEHYNMGLLNFPGKHEIIPVDGQHRVEGIKSALEANPELGENKIGAIFIGHEVSSEGKERTRRLFTTLNRYAKPVSTKDIIALDEDDVVAITTRYLLEDIKYDLFKNDRVVYSKQKGIPRSNKKAITSIITLYKCNVSIFKQYYKENNFKKTQSDFLKFRPSDEIIEDFEEHCIGFWDELIDKFIFISEYLNKPENKNPSEGYRNKETGGNLLFRPVGLEPFVQAITTIKKKTDWSYDNIFQLYSEVEYGLNKIPWKGTVWDNIDKTMIMGSKTLVKNFLIYMFDEDLLTTKQFNSLKRKYAAKLNRENEIDTILEEVPTLD